MAKIGLPKGSGKQLKVREKSVKSQGILKWILSGNPAKGFTLTLQETQSIHDSMNRPKIEFNAYICILL